VAQYGVIMGCARDHQAKNKLAGLQMHSAKRAEKKEFKKFSFKAVF